MLLLIVITSLNLAVRAQGERCGSDGLGFRCEDNGDCWEKVMLVNICKSWWAYCFDFQEFVCDGYEQCEDRSDEGKEEVETALLSWKTNHFFPIGSRVQPVPRFWVRQHRGLVALQVFEDVWVLQLRAGGQEVRGRGGCEQWWLSEGWVQVFWGEVYSYAPGLSALENTI